MPPLDVETALRRIVRSIETIERFTSATDCDGLREDPSAIEAVVRNLEMISEAAILLGREVETRCPGPLWREIRGIGNWVKERQEWNWLSAIWKTATNDLPPLKAAVLLVLDAESP